MKFLLIVSVLVSSVAVSFSTYCYLGGQMFKFGDVYKPHFDCTMYMCLPTGNFSTITCVPPNPLCKATPVKKKLQFPDCCASCESEPKKK